MTTNDNNFDNALIELKNAILEAWPEGCSEVTYDLSFPPDGMSCSAWAMYKIGNEAKVYLEYLDNHPDTKEVIGEIKYKIRGIYRKTNCDINKLRLKVLADNKYEILTKFDKKLDWYDRLTDYSDPEYQKLSSDDMVNIKRWEGINNE